MIRAFVRQTHKVDPYLKDFYEATCPGCGESVITTAKSSVVICNKCEMSFAVEIK